MRQPAVSTIVIFVAGAVQASAAACTFPPPAVVRTFWPADGEANVPTSTRVRVVYATGAFAQGLCGAPPPAPVLRRAASAPDGGSPDAGPADGGMGDGGSRDAGAVDAGPSPDVDGGAGVPGQWTITTDGDQRAGTIWEFRPAQPLAPHAPYELVDPYPETCPCGVGGCMPRAAAVFARFTTGDGPDGMKPSFGGLIGTTCQRQVCASGNDACCGPFQHLAYTFAGKMDQADAHLAGVHLYLRSDGGTWDFTHPVGNCQDACSLPLTLDDPVDAPVAEAWNVKLTAGSWHAIARAFDTSGNEDDNMVEVAFQFPLARDPLCIGIPDGGIPQPTDDLSIPVYDLARSPDLATAAKPSGCACALGRSRAPAPATLVGVLLALALRRAGRRSARHLRRDRIRAWTARSSFGIDLRAM